MDLSPTDLGQMVPVYAWVCRCVPYYVHTLMCEHVLPVWVMVEVSIWRGGGVVLTVTLLRDEGQYSLYHICR